MSTILYIPAQAAEPLNEALWHLSDPDPTRGTTGLFSHVDDLQVPSQKWLMVDTACSLPIHEGAALNGIADILAPHIGHGIEQSDIDALDAYVIAHRGQKIVVWEAFPQFFKDQAKDYRQMVAAGLLLPPSVP